MKRSTFLAVFVLVLILWGAITLFYHLGASGVDFGGSTASFDREHDRKVLRISEGSGSRSTPMILSARASISCR